MAKSDKGEIRVRLENLALIIFGAVLVVSMIVLYRGGIGWFQDVSWSRVSVLKWVAIGTFSAAGLVLEYYLLLLLRYSILRHLLWLLPVIWLFHNGLIVIQRFIEGEYHHALTGWIPVLSVKLKHTEHRETRVFTSIIKSASWRTSSSTTAADPG